MSPNPHCRGCVEHKKPRAKLSHPHKDITALTLKDSFKGELCKAGAMEDHRTDHLLPVIVATGAPPLQLRLHGNKTTRGNPTNMPEKSRLPQPSPRRRHRSHHRRCHRSLDATVILSGPPPRHPPLCRVQRTPPAPPSGAAAQTYHRSSRAETPHNPAARSPCCSGQPLADHERCTIFGAAAPT